MCSYCSVLFGCNEKRNNAIVTMNCFACDDDYCDDNDYCDYFYDADCSSAESRTDDTDTSFAAATEQTQGFY